MLMSICLPVWAGSGDVIPAGPPITCLGELICAEFPSESTLRSRALANEVLEAVYALPDQEKRYFLENRRDARGFAIFPNVHKGGILGAKIFGRGILSFRDDQGAWSTPFLLTLEGQSLGPQFGTQSSNLIFIFKRICSVEDFLSGHHHHSSNGSDVTVEHIDHEGPSEPTSMTVHVFERGTIMGQSFDNYMIHVDPEANAALYGVDVKPGCIVEGVRVGLRLPWMLRFFERLNLPDDKAHATYESRDLPSGPAVNGASGQPSGQAIPVKAERPRAWRCRPGQHVGTDH